MTTMCSVTFLSQGSLNQLVNLENVSAESGLGVSKVFELYSCNYILDQGGPHASVCMPIVACHMFHVESGKSTTQLHSNIAIVVPPVLKLVCCLVI